MPTSEKKPSVTDPESNLKVRFTDNSAKDGDFYPEDQVRKPLFLDPSGAPYALWRELEGYEIGQDARTDEEARSDHKAWEISEKLDAYLDSLEYESGKGGSE